MHVTNKKQYLAYFIAVVKTLKRVCSILRTGMDKKKYVFDNVYHCIGDSLNENKM